MIVKSLTDPTPIFTNGSAVSRGGLFQLGSGILRQVGGTPWDFRDQKDMPTGRENTYSKRAPLSSSRVTRNPFDLSSQIEDVELKPISITDTGRNEQNSLLDRVNSVLKGLNNSRDAFLKPGNISIIKTPRKSRVSEIRPRLSIAPSAEQYGELCRYCDQGESISFLQWFADTAQEIDSIVKLSESSFSEVFKMTKKGSDEALAVKIMPLLRPTGELTLAKVSSDSEPESPEPVVLDHLLHEVRCLKGLGDLTQHRRYAVPSGHTGFNRLIKCNLVEGPYPRQLFDCWTQWAEENETMNKSPKIYGSDDLHVILIMEYGGTDLEHFEFASLRQVAAVMAQILLSLSLAEEKICFEHRDLHLGNVLIKETHRSDIRIEGYRTIPTEGVVCSIIDCSLSRFSQPNDSRTTIFRDLDLDPWLFDGDESECLQYGIYRKMRDLIKTDPPYSWEVFHPKTNLLWCQFILGELLNANERFSKKEKSFYESLRTFKDDLMGISNSKQALDKLLLTIK